MSVFGWLPCLVLLHLPQMGRSSIQKKNADQINSQLVMLCNFTSGLIDERDELSPSDGIGTDHTNPP